MAYNHNNKRQLIKNVCAIVQEHHEPGNQAKCYKAVWKQYVYPVYPISYRTFLKFINAKPERLPAPLPLQHKLF